MTFGLVSKSVKAVTYELRVWRYFANYENPKNMVRKYQVKAYNMDNLRKRIIQDNDLSKYLVAVFRVYADGSKKRIGIAQASASTVVQAGFKKELLWTSLGDKVVHHVMKRDGTLGGIYR